MQKTFADLKAVIVDDQKVMRSLVRGMLKQSGITDIVEFADGDEALAFLQLAQRNNIPDFIICDLYMKNMDGMEFCNKLRLSKNDGLRYVPVLILTGESDTMLHETTRQVGAKRILKKPISQPELKQHIIDVLAYQSRRKAG